MQRFVQVLLLVAVLVLVTTPSTRADGNHHIQAGDTISRSSTDTLTADPELTLPLFVSNGEVDITIFADCGDGGLALKIDPAPGSFTALSGLVTVARAGSPTVTNLTAIDEVITVYGAGPVTVTYHLIFKVDDAPTLTLFWAQAVSDSDPTIRRRNSLISVRSLDD